MKLLYVFKHDSEANVWFKHEVRDWDDNLCKIVSCTTYYGAFDDGTWEPLFRYCPYVERIVCKEVSGMYYMYGKSKAEISDILHKAFHSGKYKTFQRML